nr:protein FAR1-RELATED SEQUENCE 5-like [Ipomoea batatas]
MAEQLCGGASELNVELEYCTTAISPGNTKSWTPTCVDGYAPYVGFRGDNVSKLRVEEGEVDFNAKQRRQKTSTRVECNAKIRFRRIDIGEYVVNVFVENHNHGFCFESAKMFFRVNDKLDIGQQTLIANCGLANIGPSKCFRVYKEVVGEYKNVEATSVDFPNFKRDLRTYIDGGGGGSVIST